jgi:hypothetical protein
MVAALMAGRFGLEGTRGGGGAEAGRGGEATRLILEGEVAQQGS